MGALNADLPLTGLRVIDLTQLLPGPLCTLKLVQAGADVIKIEPPGGDPMRMLGPRPNGRSVLFDKLNVGKTLLTLDLKREDDRLRLNDLLASADVLVEGFRPGVLDRLGYGWTTLHARHPRRRRPSVCRLCAVARRTSAATAPRHPPLTGLA